MSTNVLPLMVRSLRNWLRHRAERRHMMMVTEELGHEPDQLLSDIGLSRGAVTRIRSGAPRNF